jgi:hypothetical protein
MKALPGLILVMSVTREGRMTESVNRRKKKIYKGWCNLIPPITIRACGTHSLVTQASEL